MTLVKSGDIAPMIATCPFTRPCLRMRQEGKLAMARKAKLFAEDDYSDG
jgi:hypothetical protein